MVFSDLKPSLETGLRRSFDAVDDSALIVSTLDDALELIEDELLSRFGDPNTSSDQPDGRPKLSERVLSHFTTEEHPAGVRVIEQGADGDSLEVITSGTLAAFHVGPDGQHRRLRVFGEGSLLGEVTFFGGGQRSAEVRATTEVEVLTLSRSAYEAMKSSDPQAALELHEFVMAAQAERNASLSSDLSASLY